MHNTNRIENWLARTRREPTRSPGLPRHFLKHRPCFFDPFAYYYCYHVSSRALPTWATATTPGLTNTPWIIAGIHSGSLQALSMVDNAYALCCAWHCHRPALWTRTMNWYICDLMCSVVSLLSKQPHLSRGFHQTVVVQQTLLHSSAFHAFEKSLQNLGINTQEHQNRGRRTGASFLQACRLWHKESKWMYMTQNLYLGTFTSI